MNNNMKIYKGNIIFTPTKEQFTIIDNGYIIVTDSRVLFTVKELPVEYQNLPIIDYGNKIIIPGFNDLHIHAAQYRNRGLCLDIPLIEWLFKCTFKEEAKFNNLNYAKTIYSEVINKLWEVGSLRSLVYNTIHKESTKLLLEMFIQSGLGAYVGKVNMDIEAPDYLREDTYQSLRDTEEILVEYKGKSKLVKPIIAPRFVPACSSELMSGLGYLAKKYDTPITSHLSEAKEEIEIVKRMYPNFPTYASIYDYFGLFGQKRTVMAHCIYSGLEEQLQLKQNEVFVAHCPTSNCNLGSGMMPAREFLNKGIKMGLGSDIAGGGVVNMFAVMSYAIAVSKMIWIYSDKKLPALTSSEVFYLATKGGGAFFGKIGSFEPGYEFDALIIDDGNLLENHYTLEERIERLIHLGSESNIFERYISGNKVEKPNFDDINI